MSAVAGATHSRKAHASERDAADHARRLLAAVRRKFGGQAELGETSLQDGETVSQQTRY